MIKIKLAQLHSPIFLAGTNLGDKLDPIRKGGMLIKYDRTHKELLVWYKDQMAIVPSTNIVSMIEDIQFQAQPISEEVEAALNNPKVGAQVDSPMSHVFAGPGAGKTGRSK